MKFDDSSIVNITHSDSVFGNLSNMEHPLQLPFAKIAVHNNEIELIQKSN